MLSLEFMSINNKFEAINVTHDRGHHLQLLVCSTRAVIHRPRPRDQDIYNLFKINESHHRPQQRRHVHTMMCLWVIIKFIESNLYVLYCAFNSE